MSRQIYRQVSIITVLIVASVSLPIGIIGLTREPVINNYYEDNYYYGDNETSTEPEPYYPPETVTYYNLTGDPEYFFHRVYNLTGDHFINWYINRSNYTGNMGFYVIQDYMFDLWLEDSKNSYFIDGFGSALLFKTEWNVPFSDTWHFYFYNDHNLGGIGLNVTFRIIINKI